MRRPNVGGVALAVGIAAAGGLLVVAVAASITAVEERAPVAFELTVARWPRARSSSAARSPTWS